MVVSININEWVKVKLTDFGMSILKQRHDELNHSIHEIGGKGFGEFDPRLDEEGYRRFQMWSLIETFGPHMNQTMQSPFEDNIINISGWEK